MKKLIVICAVLLLFGIRVSAQENGNSIYTEQYDISEADEIKYALTDEAREFFETNELDPSSPDWVSRLSDEGTIEHIISFVTKGAKIPLKTGASIIGIILLTSAVKSFGDEKFAFFTSSFVSALAVVSVAVAPVWSSVSTAVDVIKGCGTFMLSFVPIFAVIMTLSGRAVTSASMSGLLLGMSQALVWVASNAVIPLMGAFLGMSICESVSPLGIKTGMSSAVKKLSIWVLSFVSMLFTGVLSVQTVVNASADSLGLKTARFIIGTSVPIAGSTISEAVSTVTASVSLLRSSVGVYGIVALAFIVLPVLCELILWRAVMLICSTVSDMFTLTGVSGILRAVDAMLSVLVGILLLTCTVFIISLSVVIAASAR